MEQRSREQNSYYWGVVLDSLCKRLSDPKQLHEIIKRRFNNGASTTSLSTGEFEDVLSKTRSWISTEFYFNIPAPNEIEEMINNYITQKQNESNIERADKEFKKTSD